MAEESIISKIHKLLALATSDNENEAALAAAKAQSLLIEYNVSDEELEEYSTVKNEKVVEVRTYGKTRSRIKWRVNLAFPIARANLCKVIMSSGSSLIWIGKKTNIEVAQYLYDTITADLERIADREWKNVGAHLSHGKTWKNSFYYGAIEVIEDRLSTNLIALKEVPANNALIVHNDVDIADYVKVKYPKLYSTYTSINRRDYSGYQSGRTAGRSIQFGRGMGAGGSIGPKLLGKG